MKFKNRWRIYAGTAGGILILWLLSIFVAAVGSWGLQAGENPLTYVKLSGIVMVVLVPVSVIAMKKELDGLDRRIDLTTSDDRYFAENVVRVTGNHVTNLEELLEKLEQMTDAYARKNGEKRIVAEVQAANRDLESFLVRYRKKK